MQTSFKDLSPVDWWTMPSDEDPLAIPDVKHCEWCWESAIDDYYVEKDPRQFFVIVPESVYVCEHCVPDYLLPEVPNA